MFERVFEQATDELLGRAQAIANEAAMVLSLSQLPTSGAGSSVVVYVNGQPQAGSLAGTANEVSITQTGTTITVAFDAGFILKGVNTAAGLRTAAGLGTVATHNQIAADANDSITASGGYVQSELQAIIDEVHDLKNKMRTSGVLAT